MFTFIISEFKINILVNWSINNVQNNYKKEKENEIDNSLMRKY